MKKKSLNIGKKLFLDNLISTHPQASLYTSSEIGICSTHPQHNKSEFRLSLELLE